jgi:hypothetical protein
MIVNESKTGNTAPGAHKLCGCMVLKPGTAGVQK